MSFTATLASNAVYKGWNLIVLFLVTILLSRLMGVEGYGILSLLIVNGTLLNLITSFGTDSGITYHVASKSVAINRILTVILLILLLQVVVLGITETVSFLINGHLWLLKTNEQKLWWLGLSFLVSISLQEKYSALLNGHHLYTLCNKTIFLCNLVTLLILALFFFIINIQSFNFYLILFVLLSLFQASVVVFIFHSYTKISFRFSFLTKPEFSLFFSYSFLVFFTNCIQFLAYRIDFWLLDFYRNEKELGWYSLAVRLVQLLWIFPLLFASILFPKVISANADYSENKMLALLRGVNAINFFAGVLSFFLIRPLIIALFGNKFQSSALAFQILLPGVILFGTTTILAAYFAGRRKLKVNFLGSLLCFISVFLLDMILIPSKGFIGAALASSIGYSVTTIYFVTTYCRTSHQSLLQLFILQKNDWNYLQAAIKKILTKKR